MNYRDNIMSANHNKVLHDLICIMCIFCFLSCSEYPEEVEKALSLSGDNRMELIKVLEHYGDSDHLKFEAACFLIGNMPYHKSKYNLELSGKYHEYFERIYSIGKLIPDANHNDSLTVMLSREYALLPSSRESVNNMDDIQLFNAEFLINNIEEAFYEWRHSPLLKNLSFEDFKEWVLPFSDSTPTSSVVSSTIRYLASCTNFLTDIFHEVLSLLTCHYGYSCSA